MHSVTYQVPNISCGHCVKTIENELGELEGVMRVRANAESKTVEVEFQDPIREQQIIELLKEIHYPAELN